MPSLLKLMESLEEANDKALSLAIDPAEKEFLKICRNSEVAIRDELKRLTGRLTLSTDPMSIEMDIARTRGSLANVMRIHQEKLVNAGVDWATEYYPEITNKSIDMMNEFKKLTGASLDTFAEIDSIHLKTALESWKESLIVSGDDYKRFVGKTVTEHVLAGVGTKQDLIKKLMDNDGLLPMTNMTRKARAKWQARNELIRISRETNAIKDADEKHFRMAGPVDTRCAPICVRYVGFIKSRKEWLRISSSTFSYGLHWGCRHKFYAIRKEWLDDDELEAMEGNKRILYSKPDRDYIRLTDTPQKFLLPLERKRKIFPATTLQKTSPAELRKFTAGMKTRCLVQEPTITRFMVDQAKFEGAKMVGLQYRVKTTASTLRKVNKELTNNLTWGLKELESQDVNDLLRYTILAEEGKYTQTTLNTLRALQKKGYTVEKVKNYWPGKGYKGVNCVVRKTKDVKFELQFHTPTSIGIKENISHPLYTKLREVNVTKKQAFELQKQIDDAWATVKNPAGVETISMEELLRMLGL